MSEPRKVAILGTVGVPGKYGGFETLADNLAQYHRSMDAAPQLTIYCSSKDRSECLAHYLDAKLRYVPFDANGPQSVLYDMVSLIDAILRGHRDILLLGVSGALLLPVLRLFTRARIITNIDGIEWRREKWRGLAKFILRISERAAVRFSDIVIADNQAIADYVSDTYRADAEVIAYGGDHALSGEANPAAIEQLPQSYALALCRIEPENNVAMILEAFSQASRPLVFVGNWSNSAYGQELAQRYRDHPNITIHPPIYDQDALKAIRSGAEVYVHGHSAGGTNPSLVEMMHFGIPVLAHGCEFNRHTTEGSAIYFASSEELRSIESSLTGQAAERIGTEMGAIARRRYTWRVIGERYFALLIG
ncbi:MAG: DUF1972 domain-containing protein [Pseudomonadota bacterium]